MKITKRAVDALTPPAKGYVLHWDDEIKGFGLRVMSTGAKSFILQKRIHGKDHRITLGRYGAVTVEQARRDAKVKAGLIASGGDPVAEKKRADLATKTLTEVLADYGETRNNIRDSTRKDMAGVLKRYSADWLKKPINTITPDKVLKRHKKIGEGAPAAANKWARYLRALLNFAAGRYTDTEGHPILTDNAVKVLSRARSWYRVERRQSVIQTHQLPAWWAAVMALRNDAHRDYFLTLLLTGLRKEEARGLAWADVDLIAKTLTVRDTKNHTAHTLPMGPYLAAMLNARERLGPLVFTSTHGQVGNLRYALEGIAKASGIKFMAHDLRRTFATMAESLDIPAYALKALLNHKRGSDVTGGYLIITTERLRGPMVKIEDYVLKAAGVKTSAEIVVLPKGYGNAV
ncbi:MAG: tyrosine-type recombinase/integrase [Acidiferrobacteraceae bacterium]